MQRRTRRIGIVMAIVAGLGLAGVADSTVSAGGGIKIRKNAHGDECYYRPLQLIAPPGQASNIGRITGVRASELGTLVPERLSNVLPPSVQRLSLYQLTSGDPLSVAISMTAAGVSAAPNYLSAYAPVRTWAPGEDPIPSGPYRPIAGGGEGYGKRIGVLDTGLNTKLPTVLPGEGPITYLRASTIKAELAAKGLVAPGYNQPAELNAGRAAGHGTFITSLLRRTLPGASLVVAQVPFYNAADANFNVQPAAPFASDQSSRVDDAALTYMMYRAFTDSATHQTNVDVLSLSFGSYGCNSAILPKAGEGDFRTPIGIRSALIGLWELSGRKLEVAAAAGNDRTDEPFYPGAYAAVSCFVPSEVPVAGPPPECGLKSDAVSPWIAGVTSTPSAAGAYSNEGRWAAVQAQGSDVGGLLGGLSWASWSGTSFAAPCAAAFAVQKDLTDWLSMRGQLIDCGLR